MQTDTTSLGLISASRTVRDQRIGLCTTPKASILQGYDSQRWNLLPVTPPRVDNNPLQTGYYRIRSLNGSYLLTMPSGQSVEDTNVYVKSQNASDSYQRVRNDFFYGSGVWLKGNIVSGRSLAKLTA